MNVAIYRFNSITKKYIFRLLHVEFHFNLIIISIEIDNECI